jgi:multiple sugar transport system permease protein
MLIIIILPTLLIVFLSFTNWSFGDGSFDYVGFENYVALFHDEVFIQSFTNTLWFMFMVLPLSLIVGLLMAVLINSIKRGAKIYRALFFLPVMASQVAMGIVWEFLLHPTIGLSAHFFSFLGWENVDLLQNSHTALMSIACLTIWQFAGFNMVLFMSGLATIPSDLYDAAKVDGAKSAYAKFMLVTWPMLGPITLFVSIYTLIRAFQVFDYIHVLTKGGPNHATELLSYTLYIEGFEYFRAGYASSIAVIFLLLTMAITLLKTYYFEKKVHYR